jgi:hypothetical protein
MAAGLRARILYIYGMFSQLIVRLSLNTNPIYFHRSVQASVTEIDHIQRYQHVRDPILALLVHVRPAHHSLRPERV